MRRFFFFHAFDDRSYPWTEKYFCLRRRYNCVKYFCKGTQNSRSLFERLAQYGLKINREKCSLGIEEVDFLGQHITKEGFHPFQDRVKVIGQYPLPKTVKELHRFLVKH